MSFLNRITNRLQDLASNAATSTNLSPLKFMYALTIMVPFVHTLAKINKLKAKYESSIKEKLAKFQTIYQQFSKARFEAENTREAKQYKRNVSHVNKWPDPELTDTWNKLPIEALIYSEDYANRMLNAYVGTIEHHRACVLQLEAQRAFDNVRQAGVSIEALKGIVDPQTIKAFEGNKRLSLRS